MKKIVLSLIALFFVAGASTYANSEVSSNYELAVTSTTSTSYTGTATTSKMFGRTVVYTVDATYTVDADGYLSGGFSVGGGTHTVELQSTKPISSSFTDIPVTGSAAGYDFTGTVSGTLASGVLTFTCTCTVGGSSSTETVFTFVGK